MLKTQGFVMNEGWREKACVRNHCCDNSLNDLFFSIRDIEVKFHRAESTCRVLSPNGQIKPPSSETSSAFCCTKRPRNT